MSEPWWADAAATRPIRVTGGIQINSTRGAVARTWWSKRFLSVLEQIGVGGRMARGRAYARQGQIVSLDIDAGGAMAKVQGSRPRPYAVRVGVPAFGKAEWAEVAAPQLLEWMLPNTSVMLAPSTLMRVASFKAMEASTETPSRASIVCSASAGVALVSSADASSGCRNLGRQFAIANLLEIPDLHAIALELEFGNVFLVDVGGARAVDEGREAPLERDVHRLFVR
jgi:hypothetical protein